MNIFKLFAPHPDPVPVPARTVITVLTVLLVLLSFVAGYAHSLYETEKAKTQFLEERIQALESHLGENDAAETGDFEGDQTDPSSL